MILWAIVFSKNTVFLYFLFAIPPEMCIPATQQSPYRNIAIEKAIIEADQQTANTVEPQNTIAIEQ